MKKPCQITVRYSSQAILIILLVLTISTACSSNNASSTSENNQSDSRRDSIDTPVSLSCLPEIPAVVSVHSQDQKLAAVIYDQAVGIYETGSNVMLYCLERYPESSTEQSHMFPLHEIYEIEFSPDNNYLGIAAKGFGQGSHVVLGSLVVWNMETGQITQSLYVILTKTDTFNFSDDSSEVTFEECLDMMQGMCSGGIALKSAATSGKD